MSSELTAEGRDTPLEDLMVAMDVVDTVRHRQLIVERELDSAGRRERLIERLREIYRAQGIEVTDAALEAGVDALEKERFAYAPTPDGLGATLARVYVRRDRWLRPLLGLGLLALLVWLVWHFTVALPQSRFAAELPRELQSTHTRITAIATDTAITARANELRARAETALRANDFDSAQSAQADLAAMLAELETTYEIRIVSRPNELSGVWRVPEINPNARNYYLIVEAVDGNGEIVRRQVRNEEDGQSYAVTKWGVRVDEATFEAVAADKRDDGIIEDYVLGVKPRGRLEPEYRVPTSGATITEW